MFAVLDCSEDAVVVPIRYNWVGVPIPKEVVSQLTARGRFETSSVITGSISNPTEWIVGVERHLFRGPKDQSLPVKWERHCDSYLVIEPGGSKEFRCEVEAVDSNDWRWEISDACGLP